MKKQWHVLQTLTGQEQKVKRYIEAQKGVQGVEELVGDVLIPTEKVAEVRGGVKTTVDRKFFPGYVLVSLVLYDDEHRLMEKPWHFIKDIQGVIGFVGGDRPAPLSESEVEAIISQSESRRDKAQPRISFEPGEMVKITDGPFMNFSGSVEEVDPDRGKLRVSVAIFGRSAPVELEYWQVERA